MIPASPRRSLALVPTSRASTRRAALAAFLLFAAALFVVGPAEASRTTDARSSLASLELSLLESVALAESIAPVESSPRFGFTEDLGLLDPERGPGGFVVFAREASRCELTYARNNPIKYVDPDGRAVETPWDAFNVALGATSLVANVLSGNLGGAAVDALGIAVDVTAFAAPGVPGGAASGIRAARLAENARNGRMFERVVLEALGAEKNTTVLSQVATRISTIPDLPVGKLFGVTDIKHVSQLSLSKQLTAQLAAAKSGDLPFNLIVSSKTVSISKNLQREISATGGRIFVFDPEKKVFRDAVIEGTRLVK